MAASGSNVTPGAKNTNYKIAIEIKDKTPLINVHQCTLVQDNISFLACWIPCAAFLLGVSKFLLWLQLQASTIAPLNIAIVYCGVRTPIYPFLKIFEVAPALAAAMQIIHQLLAIGS